MVRHKSCGYLAIAALTHYVVFAPCVQDVGGESVIALSVKNASTAQSNLKLPMAVVAVRPAIGAKITIKASS